MQNEIEQTNQDDPEIIKKQFEIFKKKSLMLAKRQKMNQKIDFFDNSFKIKKCEVNN